MVAHVNYIPLHINARTAEKSSARLLFAIDPQRDWSLEKFDITNAYINESFEFDNPVYVKEHARADGLFKHGGTIFRFVRNLWGNKLAIFYYFRGMFQSMHKGGYKSTSLEECLFVKQDGDGFILVTATVYEFLVAASN